MCNLTSFWREVLFLLFVALKWTNSGILESFGCSESSGISCDPNDVKFYLYPNSTNVSDFDELIYDNLESISGANSRFDPTKNLILLTHGFIQTFKSQFPVNVRDAYLHSGYTATTNIVVVDWGRLSAAFGPTIDFTILNDLAQLPQYVKAVENVKIVGQRVADFLIFLAKNHKMAPSKTHLVGQSLGAHVSGYAGQVFHQNMSQLLARITGTDPAGPLFFPPPLLPLIRPDVAAFVDIVHTNRGVFGYPLNLGQIDFNVNGGGPFQPGCNNITETFCAHDKAPIYYAESITRTDLVAEQVCVLCFAARSEVIFGEHCPPGSTGLYEINIII